MFEDRREGNENVKEGWDRGIVFSCWFKVAWSRGKF
jgi:hypothetical protein